MPMFEPSYKRNGVEGQILDLDTVVKDGVLGGGVDFGVVRNKVGEKLDLAKMIEEFINLVSSESNEVCNREDKRTIAPEHVLKALQVFVHPLYL